MTKNCGRKIKGKKSELHSESNWNVHNFIRSFDGFGQVIPSFNIKGENDVKTGLGGLLTAIISTITLAYAIQQIFALKEGSDPTINGNVIKSYYGDLDKNEEIGLDLGSSNHRFALSIGEHKANNISTVLDDPRYVTWLAV